MTTRAQILENEPSAARVSSVDIVGVTLIADLSGALFWEEQRLLVVSDLHLEKGSSFATRGVLLPPYDTAATLGRLAAVIMRHNPRMVIALGDSFHDRSAHQRLSASDREALVVLQARRDWIWIAGNHDPALPSNLGGVVATDVAIGQIVFRHEPTGAVGEIAGWSFDQRGRLLSCSINHRVAGLRPTENETAMRIGVGGGSQKVAAIRAALTGGLITGLITDEATARAVLGGNAFA